MKFLVLLIMVVFLVGCSNILESKTCGIKNSVWNYMSPEERLDIEKIYHEKQRLADQLRVNKLLNKQQKKISKARKANEIRQQNRLQTELKEIKKMQGKIEEALQQKQEAYLHSEPSQ